MSVHLRRRRRLVALATSAVAAATLQTALAPPAEAGQVGVTIAIQGAGKVTVVEGSLEDNAPTVCDWTSNQDHRVTHTCARVRNEEPFEAWVWLRPDPAAEPAGNWVFEGWSGCQQLRERNGRTECAVSSGAFSTDERTPTARFKDAVAPTVTSASAQQLTAYDRRFRFTFAASDGTTECRLKSANEPFAPCASPVERNVGIGSDQLQVRATDASGNVGVVRGIDVVGLETFLIPFVANKQRLASFSFSSEPGADFYCSLNYAAFTKCGTGPDGSVDYTALPDGFYTFEVFAKKGDFVETRPAFHDFWIDNVAPTTTLTPDVDGDAATFTFTRPPGTVRQECRVTGPDGTAEWTACASPVRLTGVTDGDHRFEVRSTDASGNVEAPPAAHAWTVDGSAPETTTTGPAGFVLAPVASLGLRSSEEGSTFTCTLDGAARPCGPVALNVEGLEAGTHTVTAAATDRAGNTDPTPASRSWTVPLTAAELAKGKGWKRSRYAAAYGGSYLVSSRKGATLTRSVTGARSVALVVGKGRKHGTVKVFAGSRLLRTVRTSGRGTRQLVTVASFPQPFTGSLRIVVASKDRPVRIEGLGVATR